MITCLPWNMTCPSFLFFKHFFAGSNIIWESFKRVKNAWGKEKEDTSDFMEGKLSLTQIRHQKWKPLLRFFILFCFALVSPYLNKNHGCWSVSRTKFTIEAGGNPEERSALTHNSSSRTTHLIVITLLEVRDEPYRLHQREAFPRSVATVNAGIALSR